MRPLSRGIRIFAPIVEALLLRTYQVADEIDLALRIQEYVTIEERHRQL